MFELVENRLFTYADDLTLLRQLSASQQTAVDCLPYKDFARIQEWRDLLVNDTES